MQNWRDTGTATNWNVRIYWKGKWNRVRLPNAVLWNENKHHFKQTIWEKRSLWNFSIVRRWKSSSSGQNLLSIKAYSLPFEFSNSFAQMRSHNLLLLWSSFTVGACQELRLGEGETLRSTFPCCCLANDKPMLYPKRHLHLTDDCFS